MCAGELVAVEVVSGDAARAELGEQEPALEDEVLLAEWVDADAVEEAFEQGLIPPVARTWLEWLMGRRALDKPARMQIKRQLDALPRRFQAV